MLLPKLNAICEEVKCSLMSKEKSVNPAPQKAEPNKSLTKDAPSYFNDKDDTRTAQKTTVPREFARKFKRKKVKSK